VITIRTEESRGFGSKRFSCPPKSILSNDCRKGLGVREKPKFQAKAWGGDKHSIPGRYPKKRDSTFNESSEIGTVREDKAGINGKLKEASVSPSK